MNVLDVSIFTSRYPSMITYPDDTLYHTVMGQSASIEKEIRICVGSTDIEYPYFLLLATRQKMLRCR